jgi:hypothetical protein
MDFKISTIRLQVWHREECSRQEVGEIQYQTETQK